MATEDGRYVISYNGEVYNFNELRIELIARGHRFHSRTDSEVVLKSLVEWGREALLRLNGMFAFAIWDKQERRLFLARDRYGIKPLYYAWSGSTFLFASEIKAILAIGSVIAKMNKAGLLEYLTFQNFFTDQTLFEGVNLLPAGTSLEVLFGNRPSGSSPQRYWDYCFLEPENPAKEEEYIEELRSLVYSSGFKTIG